MKRSSNPVKSAANQTSNVGKRGSVLIRPAVAYPVEIYTPERKAEFLLSNAINAADYRRARQSVRELGLDPDRIRHYRPAGVDARVD